MLWWTRTSLRWFGISFVFILVLVSHETLAAQPSPNRYYYYEGARIPLAPDPTVIAVRFDAALARTAQKSIADATGEFGDFNARADSPVGGLVFVPLRAGSEPTAAVERLAARPGIEFASPVYAFRDGQLAETDEFLARFPEGWTDTQIAELNARYGVSIARPVLHSDGVLVLKPNRGNARSALELANAYVEAGVVEFAEPNFVVRQTRMPQAPALMAEIAPSDDEFIRQWSLRNTQQFQGSVSGADIKAMNAWDVTQGASSIRIAVIDEGVTASHPELAGKTLTGYNAMNGTNNTTPKLNDHHGTAIAGVIGAQSNNNDGIAGVCWACRILPVKVAETDALGNWVTTPEILSNGIRWAWQNGADVLNNSWTMPAPSNSVLLELANARFEGRGGRGSTIVFASGNQDSNVVSFPATLNSYVIAVGATNWCDQRKTPTNNQCNNNDDAWGSNYGTALDLVAPGEAIFSACNDSQCTNYPYTYASGTSLAAPHVSGVVGLLYTLNPDLTPDKVQEALQTGAQDLGPAGPDNETGYGRLDAYRTLASLFNLKLKVNNSLTLMQPGATVTYRLKYLNTGRAATSNTRIFVQLPNHTTYASSTPTFTHNGGGVYRLDLGTLPAGAKGVAKFRVQLLPSAAGQPLKLDANITSAYPEFNLTDNADSKSSLGIKRNLFLPLLKRNAH